MLLICTHDISFCCEKYEEFLVEKKSTLSGGMLHAPKLAWAFITAWAFIQILWYPKSSPPHLHWIFAQTDLCKQCRPTSHQMPQYSVSVIQQLSQTSASNIIMVDWLLSNWYINQHKIYLCFTKIQSFGMSFSLIWMISYELLTGKGDDMCRKVV